MKHYDVAIIGAGHNGLTCAAYLAQAGLEVIVLEARDVIGGAAVTEEFHPGFRNSSFSYTVSLLNPKVMRELNLAAHGLRVVERPYSNFLPLADGYFKYGGGLAATQAEVARFSPHDAQTLPRFYERIERAADAVRELLFVTPPTTQGGVGDWLRLWRSSRAFTRMDAEGQRDMLMLAARSAGEWLDSEFECEPLKAAMGFDSVVGNFASPYTPGSAYVLLHHAFGEVNGKKGTWGHAIGGMGAITQAIAKECAAHGVVVRVSAPIKRVLIERDTAVGVELANGETIRATRVSSNVAPQRLFLDLVASEALPAWFVERVRHLKAGSGAMRINLALAELPRFECSPQDDGSHHRSGIIMAPSLAYMDDAYTSARELGFSREPIVEMLIASTLDDTLAPNGAHVASLFCQQFAPTLRDGQSWDAHKDSAVRAIFAVIDRFAPNFSRSVLGYRAYTPLDLERTLGLPRGDIFHGALTLDQLFAARPLLGYGDYRTPIKGLYLCGSGAHPGGGVTGVPGHNCAREILRDRRWANLGFAKAP